MAHLPVHAPTVLHAQVVSASEMSDAEIGQAAAAAVDRSLASRADSVEQAIRAGELLRGAKQRCRERGHSWSDWCRRWWPKSRKTADTYIAVSLEVSPEISGGRAPNVSQALTLPSVRALLTDAGLGAGGTRDRSEPDGLREPGADEDEDLSNVPTDPLMREPTEREQATVDRLSAEQAQSDQERAAERLRKRDEWRAKQDADRRQAMTDEEKARRAALAADEAKKRAEREAELAAMKAAEDRDPLKGPPPPKPRPQPADADERPDPGPDCKALEGLILAIGRRWGAMKLAPAPMIRQFGRETLHPRDDDREFIAEWVGHGPKIIERMRSMVAHDAALAKAGKRSGGAA